MRRLILLATLAAALVVPTSASAFLNLDPATLMMTTAVNNDFRFRVVAAGYPNNVTYYYPPGCFSGAFGQLPGQGCYVRRSDSEIAFFVGRLVGGYLPEGYYQVNVIGNNSCAYVVSHENSRIFWPGGSQTVPYFATTQGCG